MYTLCPCASRDFNLLYIGVSWVFMDWMYASFLEFFFSLYTNGIWFYIDKSMASQWIFHSNYARMLHDVLNKPWKQHPTKQLLYSHLSPISCSHIDSCTWTHLFWLTNKDLHSSVLCRHWMLSRGLTKSYSQLQIDSKKEPSESMLLACTDDETCISFLFNNL